jgi:hypothetical protein
VDGGSSINVTFPRTLQALGVAIDDLTVSDTPFFGIVPTEGEHPLGHIYMSVTFGTPCNPPGVYNPLDNEYRFKHVISVDITDAKF